MRFSFQNSKRVYFFAILTLVFFIAGINLLVRCLAFSGIEEEIDLNFETLAVDKNTEHPNLSLGYIKLEQAFSTYYSQFQSGSQKNANVDMIREALSRLIGTFTINDCISINPYLVKYNDNYLLYLPASCNIQFQLESSSTRDPVTYQLVQLKDNTALTITEYSDFSATKELKPGIYLLALSPGLYVDGYSHLKLRIDFDK